MTSSPFQLRTRRDHTIGAWFRRRAHDAAPGPELTSILRIDLPDDLRLAQREIDVERREIEVAAREQALAGWPDLAEAHAVATRQRHATSDALDGEAEQWERAQDLARMLSPHSDEGYGFDWPARRLAALHREHAKADRVSSLGELNALVAHYRDLLDNGV